MVNSFISKVAIIPPKKQVVKIKMIEADSDIDGDGNHTSQDCTKFNSTCLLHVNHPQLLKRNIFLYLCFWSLEAIYLCKCNMYICKNTLLLICGSSTHKTLARTGIGRFVKRFFNVLGACRTSYIVRHRWNRTIILLYKNRPVPGRCHFTLNDPTKCRTGAVEF